MQQSGDQHALEEQTSRAGGLGPCPTLTCDDQLWVEEAGVLLQLVVVYVAGIGIHLWKSRRPGSRCCLQPHGPPRQSTPSR